MKAQWKMPSHSDPDKTYTITLKSRKWSCSCIGWTRHYPRKDCIHIREVKTSALRRAA